MHPRRQSLLLPAAALCLGAVVGHALFSRKPRFSFQGKVVVITGGSRGLGLVLARQLAVQGALLALIARDAEELDRACDQIATLGGEALSVPCDVRNQEEVKSSVARIVATFGRIDVLINNAGIIQVGPFDEMLVEDFADAMAVHFFGPLYLTMAAIPFMRAGGEGRVVNISSVGGKIAVPHLLPYVASKFALVGLSDGLRSELKRQNIFVTTVCPGLMRTGSARNALFKGRHQREYAWFSITGSMPVLSMNAETAARRIILACRRGDARLVIGAHTGAAVLLNELAPGVMSQLLSLTNRVLPSGKSGTKESKKGHESESFLAPSWLTHLNEKAAARNNEIVRGSPNRRPQA